MTSSLPSSLPINDEHEAPPALKAADHQVGGHRFDEGRLGSLVDDKGRFYKPLQGGDRGRAEASFYERIHADPSLPAGVREVFPDYFGIRTVPTVNGAGHFDHLVMEDVAAGYSKPCIIDIKMGKRTWYEGASQKYIDKCLEKDSSTTSGELGLRIVGLQVYDPQNDKTWKAGRDWCKKLKSDEVETVLRRFVSSNPLLESSDAAAYDAGLADDVFGGEGGLLLRLQELKKWFLSQGSYHFFSASILVIFEGNPKQDSSLTEDGVTPEAKESKRRVHVRMVDFAHVVDGKGQKDENFLAGIYTLEGILNKILAKSNTS